jgi:N-acetylmuramoyl-L-alanine amidase
MTQRVSRFHVLAWPLIAAAQLAAASALAQGRPTKTAAPACERSSFHVILDVGHTAEDPGAISVRSRTEYDFNLDLARQIERALHASGFAKTALQVTSGPALPALIRRVAVANASKADLLISIHHDSVPHWLLQHMDDEGGPRRFSDRFRGHSLFVSYENAARSASLQFARLLGEKLKGQGLLFARHYTERIMGPRRRELVDKEAGVYRFDKLYVLRASRMPAVLFEAGLIINPGEELELVGEERQVRIATAMTQAVEDFCRQQTPPTASARARR